MLRRQPGFSLAVALTLALGLGLNATVLGMMDALLLRPFQFRDYERLVVIWETPRGTSERQAVSAANYLDWRAYASSVQHLVAWEGWGATVSGRDEPERVQGFRVSPGFFEVLGIIPAVGRSFRTEEEQPGSDRTIIIGDGLWKRRFGGDPAAVGTRIRLDGESYTLVGIAPPGFDFPTGSQFWSPLAFSSERARDRRNRTLTVLGELAPGTSLADASAELDTIGRRLEQQYPETNKDRGAAVHALSNAFREGGSGAFVGIIQAGAVLVLLIACANLAGLLLARANDRYRELALRAALGAGRMRLVRQLMTETVLLAIGASAVALLLARVGLDVLRSSMPAEVAQHIEGWNNVRLDERLIVAIPALAMVLGLVVGLIPAFAAYRTELTTALKEGERSAPGGAARQRVRQALAAGEIAIAFALLVAAGLVLGGGARLVSQPGGFDAAQLLTFDIALPDTRYSHPDSRRELASTLLARIEAIPAVQRAALASVLPAAGWSPTVDFVVEENPNPDPARQPRAGFRAVSAGYFEAMRIPIVAGRTFSSVDREESQQVAIVSASLAAQVWPGREAVGRRLRVDPASDWLTIVGVAGDVTMYNWWDGIDVAALYVPLRQAPPASSLSAAVRTRGEPAAFSAQVRAAVASVDPLLAIHGVRTMEEAIVASTFGLRFLATLMGICGGIALLLSFVGIYSMMAYAVSHRMHEFGVRMALGATSRDVLGLTLKQTAVLTAAGLLVGIVVAIVLGGLMSSALFGLISLDARAFTVVTIALGGISLLAAYMPVRRALRLDPSSILRAN